MDVKEFLNKSYTAYHAVKYGAECDLYSIMAEIKKVRRAGNSLTGEEILILTLSCNGLYLPIFGVVYNSASASLCMQMTSLGLTVLITFSIVWRSYHASFFTPVVGCCPSPPQPSRLFMPHQAV